MRPAAPIYLAALVTLAGCANHGDTWRDHRRARLERMHEQRPLDQILAEVIDRAPAAASSAERFAESGRPAPRLAAVGHDPSIRDRGRLEAPRSDELAAASPQPERQDPSGQNPSDQNPSDQEPEHIDQRLPAATSRERRFRHSWQPLVVAVDYGLGDVMARRDGSRLGDRTDAVFARARVDVGTGAALHVEWWRSDGDLFAGKFLNDGVVPRRADAELGGVDVFPHVRLDHRSDDGAWSLPVRIGLFSDWQQLDHQQARVERDWLSFGPRIVVEPTWTMLAGDDGDLQLFTTLGGDLGAAWFSEEFVNGDDRDVTARWSGELGAGLRGRLGAWHAELGYRLRHTMFGETSGDLYGRPGRTELQRQQIFFGLGFCH